MGQFRNRMRAIADAEFRPTVIAASLVCAYVTFSMCSNIMSVRTILLFGFAVDAGTLLYPLTFVLRDFIQRRAGRRVADLSVIISFCACAFMFLAFTVAAKMPPDPAVGPQNEFAQVLLPSGRIVLGSLVGAFTAEMIDGGIYSRVAMKRGNLAKAMVVSNLISIPLDSLIFSCIAFIGRVPFATLVSIILMNIAIKYVVMAIFIPVSLHLDRRKRRADI